MEELKNEKQVCAFCGRELEEDEIFTLDDVVMCAGCFETRTTVCDCCGDRIFSEDDYGDENISLCESCRDNHYYVCYECGRLIHESDSVYDDSDGEEYCQSCYERHHQNGIHRYGYKPSPVFYGQSNLFYGVELEIDKGGEDNESAERLNDIANSEGERIYCKHDGSLDEGFEIVSHPMTLEYHTSVMPWESILREAVFMGYRSHQTLTCGLHIHVNRGAFGVTYEKQEDTISRIVFFVENHWNELVRFSRRKEEQLERWSSRYGISENTKITYDKAKKKNLGRYVAVNLTNDSTIEFRLFRGTLRYQTFIAAIQLVDEICRLAIRTEDKEAENMTWGEFVMGINADEKPELVEYLKSKQLFVNELVEEGAEL